MAVQRASAANMAEAPGRNVQEALEAIFTKIEQGHLESRKMHLEVLQAIGSRQIVSRRSEAWTPQPGRRSAPTLGTEENFSLHPLGPLGPAPSMQEMQNATRQALTDSFSLYQSFSKTWSQRRSLQSVGEESPATCVVPTLVPTPTVQGSPIQKPSSPHELIFEKPGYGSMQSMDRQSQAQILSTGSDHSAEDLSSRLLTAYPRCLALAVCVPTVFQLVCMSWLAGAGYVNALNLVSTGVYTVLAIVSVTLLDQAWRSSHFEIAVARLQLLVEDFKKRWRVASCREWRRYTAAWLVSLATFAATQVLQAWMDDQEGTSAKQGIARHWVYTMGALNLVSYGVSSAIVLQAAFIQTDLLLGLDKTLDCWCCQIVNHNMDFSLGAESWNAIQALLKSVARELASSFLALQILSGVGFVYFLAVGVTFVFRSEHRPLPLLVEVLSSLPLVWLFLLSLHVCAHGAELTEKCQGIPAFVNQILTRSSLDADRQYLVRFIADSSAGFIVRDTKLTRELFMKQLFLFVGLLSALVSVLSRLYF